MADHDHLSPETRAIVAGYNPATSFGAAKPPMVLTSTFVYPDAQTAKDIHQAFFDDAGPMAAPDSPDAYIYARLGHPNLTMVETRLATLDGAANSVVFASGMAAITTTLLSVLRPGDSVLCSRPGYGGTDGFINTVLPQFGVHALGFWNGCDEASVRAGIAAAMAAGPLRLIHLETPANPTAAIVDIALVRRVADELVGPTGTRPLILVDNTFLGPLQQSPLAHGADLVMTSLTKYCAGHSDMMAGGVSGSVAAIAPIRALRTLMGNHLEPFSAWLLLRSFETLALRTDRTNSNAAAIATWLQAQPKVLAVTWLGFIAPDSPEAAVAARQFSGYGSTFSFRVADETAAFRLLDRLRLLRLAVSLGGTETLICHPATTTHYQVPRDRREAGGIFDGTLRVSVGIEAPADLIADLAQALEAV